MQQKTDRRAPNKPNQTNIASIKEQEVEQDIRMQSEAYPNFLGITQKTKRVVSQFNSVKILSETIVVRKSRNNATDLSLGHSGISRIWSNQDYLLLTAPNGNILKEGAY